MADNPERKNILVISPHPDDAEGGFGGTILKLVKLGYNVHLLDLTDGEPTPHGSVEIRKQERENAARMLGVKSRTTLDLPNRFLFDTKEARIKTAEVMRVVKPHTLFLPYWVDAHPDHVQASLIGDAARFYAKFSKTDWDGEPWYPAKVFYYLCSHLRLHVDPVFIMDITDEFEKKMEIAKSYKSQFSYDDERWNMIGGIITSVATYYGHLAGVRYGEPVMCKEKIGLRDIRDIT